MKYETKNSKIVIGCISFFYKNNRIMYIYDITTKISKINFSQLCYISLLFGFKYIVFFKKYSFKLVNCNKKR